MGEPEASALERMGKAFHEAGHSVVAHYFNNRLTRISIRPQNGLSGGVSEYEGQNHFSLNMQGVFFENTPERDAHICHHIMITMAGEIAQELFRPESLQSHHGDLDRISVNALIRRRGTVIPDTPPDLQIDELSACTRKLIGSEPFRSAIGALARELIDHEELSGEQARDVIRRAGVQLARQPVSACDCPLCIYNEGLYHR